MRTLGFARRILRPWAVELGLLVALVWWGASQFSSEHVSERLEEIRRESVSRGAADWAGVYSRGSITPQPMGIAPDAGYQRATYACGGFLMDASRGAVRVEGDRVHLGPAWPFFWRTGDFELVRWGERLYLIEPDRMHEFVAHVNQGWEPRDAWSGVYFMKCANPRVLPLGQPQLPPEFAKQLLPRLEGHVIAVTRCADAQDRWELELDLGSARGAYVARRIWVAGPDSLGFAFGELTEVREQASRAVVDQAELSPPPAVGWRAALELGP